jgi:Xaa-Pro aminopeptidase
VNKDQAEAVRIAVTILKHISFQPGETEKQVACRIEAHLKEYGAKPAFRTIVASGPRSAKPHGYATNKKIKPGEIVMVDMGALYHGVRSDLTRTFLPPKPTKKQRMIYRIIKEAQSRGIKAVRAGVEARKVDAAARDYIKARGYGLYFIHTTGHGVGRRIHEAPKLSRRNHHKLKAGQVITIEPGIYIKGWGGVRIEDMVLVTGTGCRLLTTVTK